MNHIFRPLTPRFVFLLLVLIQIGFQPIEAQPRKQKIEIVLAPERSDWTYEVGEDVNFNVMVFQNGNPLEDVSARYEIRPEKMEPIEAKDLKLKNGTATIKVKGMKTPGFLRCWIMVDYMGKEYRNMATAGFVPEEIKPTIKMPSDFETFWNKAKEENQKIPMDTKMTLIPDRCTEKVNVYHVNIQNYEKGSRIYGLLCMPKGKGPFPAVLEVPGAGIRPYYGRVDLAEEGIISLQIGIHGIPVTLDPQVYTDLRFGALNGYWTANLDDKDEYYYKRVYVGCVRAVDMIFSLPEFDGENVAVTGGSQGGALSIVTAGLDDRIKYLAANYPALCDLTGYLEGRAGGWPHMFHPDQTVHHKDDKITTAGYYDVVNFARQVKVKGWYSWGFNDTVCPPTSMYSAYNVIGAEKELHLFLETGHWTFPEQGAAKKQWLLKQLK